MDFLSMLVLAALMFAFAYAALRNVREELDEDWERELLRRDRHFYCTACSARFEFVEYLDSPFGAAVCPHCGSTETRAWLCGADARAANTNNEALSPDHELVENLSGDRAAR